MLEKWTDIPGFGDNYEVSNTGKVRNKSNGRLLKGNHTKGYRYVVLSGKGYQKCPKVHRLVAEAFIPNPDNHICINHIDGVKTNNHVSNLEWCTYQHNSLHSFRLGLQKPLYGDKNPMYGVTGEDHPASKPIVMKSLNDEPIKEFVNLERATEWLKHNGHPKANNSSISLCARGLKYKKAYGYKWEYKEAK